MKVSGALRVYSLIFQADDMTRFSVTVQLQYDIQNITLFYVSCVFFGCTLLASYNFEVSVAAIL